MKTAERPPKPFADSAFKQQQLSSYYPQHSAAALSIALLFTASLFIPIGVLVVVESDNLFEFDVRYDNVNNYRFPGLGHDTFAFNSSTMSAGTNCKKVITLTKTMQAPIYIYYRLTNYHQNYRQYQESRNDAQLIGDSSDSTSYCEPFQYPGQWGGRPGTADGKPYGVFHYNPCGAIPWSMFNDSIAMYKITASTPPIDTSDPTLPSNLETVCLGTHFSATGVSTTIGNQCKKKGIALEVDRDSRYKSAKLNANTWSNSGQPGSTDPFLAGGYYAFEAGHKVPLATDEDLMVWARTASMPDFLKLYRVITMDLVAGDYLIDIMERYDTTSFHGEKHIVLATRSWIGTKNYVLGVSLIVMGCLSFVSVLAIFALKCREE